MSCVVISANAFIDSLFAGRFLGTGAMASIGLFGPINTIFSGIACVFATGAQQLCCTEMGEGNSKRLKEIFNIGALFLFFCGALFMILLFLFKGSLASGLGATGEMHTELSHYILGIAPGVITQLLATFLMPFLQINGHNRLCYLVMAVNLLGNTIFNTIFVAVLSWGLFGMGLATSLSSILCFVVMLPVFCKKDGLARFDFQNLVPKDIVNIVRIGSPVLMFHVGLFIKNYGMNCALLKGSVVDSVAVLTLQGSICGILGALGFGNGTVVQILASFFIGEDDKDSVGEVFKVAMKNGILLYIPTIAILLSISMPLLRIFGLAGGETEIMAKRMLYMLALAILLNLILTVFVKMLQAAEKLTLTNTMTFLENALQGVITFLFVGKLGADAAWIAFPAATSFCLLLLVIYGLSGSRGGLLQFLHFPENLGKNIEARTTLSIHKEADVAEASNVIEKFCLEHGVSEKTSKTTGLCVEEMAGNVVKHGFEEKKKGIVWVLLAIQKEKLVLRIRDNSVTFNPKEYLQLSHDDNSLEHIGIRLVSKLVDNVEYHNVFGMNMLTIEVKK